MKTVGIIGGFGPKTTAKFFMEIIFSCFKENKKSRPPILIWSVPIPFRVEEDLIINNQGEERFLPFLIDAAKNLERSGADFLVLPCNSLHIFIEEIRKAVNIPVLSIVEETIKVIKKQNITNTGILSTSITFKRNLFQKALKENHISFKSPEKEDQVKLSKIIHKVVLNKHTDKDHAAVKRIIKNLGPGVKNIILACTDLQLIVPPIKEIRILDTMKILADATTIKILNQKTTI